MMLTYRIGYLPCYCFFDYYYSTLLTDCPPPNTHTHSLSCQYYSADHIELTPLRAQDPPRPSSSGDIFGSLGR